MNAPSASHSRTRVLVIDSHRSVAGLVTVFVHQYYRGLQVIEEAGSAAEGLDIFFKYHPAIVISALNLSDGGSPAMLRRMRVKNPNLHLVIYTGTTKLDLLYEALDLAPRGFVHKSETLQTLGHALEAVAQGSSYLSPYAGALLDRRHAEDRRNLLTPQETLLVQLIAEGLLTKQIADRLQLSPKTVENYRKQIMTKLGLNGVAQITAYAMRQGIVA